MSRASRLGIEDAGANVDIATTEYYDATQTDVTAQMQRLKADDVDVVGFYGMPAQAAGGIKAARETLNWNVPFVITGVDAVEIVAQLAGYDNIAGTVSVVYGHQAFETQYPGVKQHHDIMAKYAPGTPVTTSPSPAWPSLCHGDRAATGGPRPHAQQLPGRRRIGLQRTICWGCLAPTSMSPTDHRRPRSSST